MDFLSNHPEVSDDAPIMGTVVVENGMVEVPTIDATGLELMWTTGEIASDFQSIAMSDDGTQGDAIPNDGTYTAILPETNGENLMFYIRASNAGCHIIITCPRGVRILHLWQCHRRG